MRNVTLGDLRLGLEDLLDTNKPRFAVLSGTTAGKLYIPILTRKLASLAALPEAREPGRELTEEIDKTDGAHDGYGGAFWDLTGAYLRAPDTPEQLRKILLELRDVFLTGLSELRATHSDEATKAKERIKKLDAHRAQLELFPVLGGKTLYDWVKAYLENGVRLDNLMSERTYLEASKQEGSRSNAGPLRGEVLGALTTLRAALDDERKENSALPGNIDGLIFGYFDELQSKRTPHQTTKEPAPEPSK